MTTLWLSTHLSYACRHSGACCTAGWPIPIEPDRAASVEQAVADGRVAAPVEWYRQGLDHFDAAVGILAHQPSGACVFHQPPILDSLGRRLGGGCSIHSWRPRSCEHFPYVCVIDPRGVHVTLSHYCPTAASLLFDTDEPATVVEGPSVLGADHLPEGLDATEALPPADEDGRRLLSWPDVTAFEVALVTRLNASAEVPDAPESEPYQRARMAVLPGWSWPDAPADARSAWHRLVAPAWADWMPVVGRYLASKAHASWAMCLGDGPRAVERLVDLARTVLQVEAIRACVTDDTALDRARMMHAIRRADLLLVHLTDPRALVESSSDSAPSRPLSLRVPARER